MATSGQHRFCAVMCITALLPCAMIGISTSSNADQDSARRSSLTQRPPARGFADGNHTRGAARGDQSGASFPQEFRTIDGSFNNLSSPGWGAAGAVLLRLAEPAYADGTGSPARPGEQSAREISNNVCDQSEDHPNAHGSAMIWQWGQFLDHDIDETPVGSPAEHFDITVPTGDAWFDPFQTGTQTIPLDRSAFVTVEGVREQLNNITAYIDASNVYGSSPDRAAALRTLDGTGRLKTSDGDLLPFNTEGIDNAPSPDPGFFLAGDIRCNEQIGLTAMHTVFVREHNHWATWFGMLMPELDGDSRYEYARAMVGAQMQHITYNEFLPMLLGPDALPPYNGYQPGVNPGISNEFATAAFRVGHTMLSSPMLRVDAAGDEINAGHLDLADAFFNPAHILNDGVDPVLRGLAAKRTQEIDIRVIHDVRNFLFGPPGAGGFDLASLNIQRGRDHGLPSYNDIRAALGLSVASTIDDISPDPFVRDCLASSYDDVDSIDPWIGMLAEPHAPGAMVGETIRAILIDQFTRLRDGDRFWYEIYLPEPMLEHVQSLTLADIIRRNTDIGDEFPDNPFVLGDPCPADLDDDGSVGLGDLLEVIGHWGAVDASAGDANGDSVVDLQDLLVVIAAWGESC